MLGINTLFKERMTHRRHSFTHTSGGSRTSLVHAGTSRRRHSLMTHNLRPALSHGVFHSRHSLTHASPEERRMSIAAHEHEHMMKYDLQKLLAEEEKKDEENPVKSDIQRFLEKHEKKQREKRSSVFTRTLKQCVCVSKQGSQEVTFNI